MPVTLCNLIRAVRCGHVCNAYCRDEHCDVLYSPFNDPAEALQRLKERMEDDDVITRLEPAPEAVPWNDLSEGVKSRYVSRNGGMQYTYLVHFKGCPVPCPQSAEHEGRE